MGKLKSDNRKVQNEQDYESDEKEPLRIYTADLETDPFKRGLLVEAFVCGFYDGTNFVYFWGKDWLERFTAHLESIPPGIVYFHNGGKFDFYHMMELFDEKMLIIGGRIVVARSKIGGHQFRDSLAILPMALSQYKKDDIDINKLKRKVRNKHREEIIKYLKGDCVYLYELVSEFQNTFGDNITVGGTAMKELKKVHAFTCLDEATDTMLRGGKDKDGNIIPGYFYGGRVQCFETGVIKRKLKVYDVNSMYPSVMRDFKHPIGKPSEITKKISRNTFFITVEGTNYGAFPSRTKSGIDFTKREGIFHVTIHEWRVAIRHSLFVPKRIIRCINYDDTSTFKKFVLKFYNLRVEAKISDDDLHALFYKFILVSVFGKFAQNPKNYRVHKITSANEDWTDRGWHPTFIYADKYTIWSKPSEKFNRFNVGTAASITGAARSILLDALATAKGAVYCDTDSIICSEIGNSKIDDSELGAWKLEKTGSMAVIARKKLYGLFETNKKSIKKIRSTKKTPKEIKAFENNLTSEGYYCLKQANKGVRVTPEQIMEVGRGKEVVYYREAPSYKLDGNHKFLKRTVRMAK